MPGRDSYPWRVEDVRGFFDLPEIEKKRRLDERFLRAVRLAWERIRTYPAHRPGSVSGNVLLDVRKRYSREHDGATRTPAVERCQECEPSPEDRVVARAFLDELVACGKLSGVSSEVLATILRSRVDGESMADLAAEQQVPVKVLWHRRWRGEARLRELRLAS